MEYEDFQIEIQPDVAGGHRVRVLASPAGEGRSFSALGDQWTQQVSRLLTGQLPQETREPLLVDQLVKGMGHEVRGSADGLPAQLERDVAGRDTFGLRLSPKKVGEDLFYSLFFGTVLELYIESLGIVQSQPKRGLRIKLHLALSEPGTPQISCLPWEFLYRPQTKEFLSLGRKMSVVRYLEIPQPVESLPITPPLRILVAIASPAGSQPLDLARERNQLEVAMRSHPELELVFLEQATLPAIAKALASRSFHVFHFMGHGSFDERTGRGALLFENSVGEPHLVSGESLAVILSRTGLLRLVFLNACDTARTTRSDGLDPFAGVAAALMLGGLPAVLAMQFRISDAAAIEFSSAFYGRLATSMPVDEATAEARAVLYSQNPDSFEWGTPALFMRSKDGKLFELSRIPFADKREALRLASSTYDDQLELFEQTLLGQDPGWNPGSGAADLHQRVHRLIDLAALRGTAEWLEVTETLLSARSPFYLFDGSLSSWDGSPRDGTWQVENGDLLGQGKDPFTPGPISDSDLASRSLLLWRGLRFRDGVVGARLWWSELGGAGLVLRHSESGAVLGVLHCLPEGLLVAQIWQLGRADAFLLGSEPLPEVPSDGYWDVGLQLEHRRATLLVGNLVVSGEMAAEIAAGHAGLVKLAGASMRANELRLTVNPRRNP